MRRHTVRSIVVSILVSGALAVVLGTAPAGAASPIITIDSSPQAEKPAVAISADGTAHIAWERSSGSSEAGDELHYCRLPRGATACDRQETFVPDDANAFGWVSVLVREDGRVQLVEGRCCFAGEHTMLVESADGGSTFAAPRQIGTIEGADAIAGPGPNAITGTQSGAASGRSVAVQVMATDGGIASGIAELQDGDGRWYPGGVGLIDSSTPIFAYGDLTNTYIRRYDATKPNFNDGASWLPSTTIPGEDEPRLVTGTAGTYVMTRTVDAASNNAYLVRRISQTDGALSPPESASDLGDPIFGTLTADQGGGLTSVWTVPSSQEGAPIYARGAPSGGAFSKTGTLVDQAVAFNMKASTAPDHGGFVVWDAGTQGTVSAAAIPAGGVVPDQPAGGGGAGDCTTEPKTVKTGIIALVSNGCWKDLKNGRFETVGDVNVSGITLVTDGKKTKVTIDTKKHTISATQGVVEKAGSIILAKDKIDWDLDGGPKVFDRLDTAGPGGKAILLFDFAVRGTADVTFVPGTTAKPGSAKVGVNLQMPAPFDSITGRAILTTTTAGGLQRSGVGIHVANASIGPFSIKRLDVFYDGDLSRFTGDADITIPPDGGEIKAGIVFQSGSLESIYASYSKGTPLPFAITPYLWLNSVGFSYTKVGGFTIGGGAEFGFPSSLGPFILDALGDPPGTGAGFTFFIPSGKSYAEMSLAARLKVFGFDIGGFRSTFVTTGEFTFDADLSIGIPDVLGVFGTTSGKFNFPQKEFYAAGSVQACVLLCVGADVIASNIGVSVCPNITFGIDPFSFDLRFQVGYKWKSGLDVGLGCNQGPYLPANAGPPPGDDDVGSKASVTLKAANVVQLPPNFGDPYTIGMEVRGSGGLPGLKVTDEGTGATIIESDPDDLTKPVQAGSVVMVPNPGTNSVRFMILREGGTNVAEAIKNSVWRIEQAGGAPIALRRAAPNGTRNANGTRATISGISFAREYDPTKVTAKLGGKGRQRSFSYKATNLGAATGRSLQFVEVGDKTVKVLGSTKKASGSVRYTIFDGPAGKRRVEARVLSSAGLPVSAATVASYRAPGYVLPGKAKKIRLKRDSKGRLKLTWKGTTGAARRVVLVSVADGRLLRFEVKRNAVTIPGVDKKERVTVKIRGVTKLGRQGPQVTARR